MKEKWNELLSLVPMDPDEPIHWNIIEQSALKPYIDKMKCTMQNPLWHGEGDVWTHTKMVCEEAVRLNDYIKLPVLKRQILFLSCLFHDFGKIPCTKWEDGVWTSPYHTSASAHMAREILWKEYDFCGTKELQSIRETICALVKNHSVPSHIFEHHNPNRRLIKIAADGELLPDFSLYLLSLLVEADLKGRIQKKEEDSLENLELFREFAKECGCYNGPKDFPSAYSEYAYLSGKNVLPGQDLYDDTWGVCVLLSGLPGTGKDTYIKEHFAEIPVISLDQIRKELKVSPDEKQGVVIQTAQERAKGYLRKKQAFVWNATNVLPLWRSKITDLITSYGASAKIIYLETSWMEEQKRNKGRKEEVPDKVIEKMLSSLVPPQRWEAHSVEWYCI